MGLPAHFVEPQAAWVYGGFRILRFLSWELGLRVPDVPDVTLFGLGFRVGFKVPGLGLRVWDGCLGAAVAGV